MKIYDFEGFPNPARVRIALAEKQAMQDVEFVSVNVPAGEHQEADFLSKNPNAAVPVLELDDGTCISECTAITEYIDHSFDGISLTGETAKERAVVHMMQRRAEQNLLDAVAAYFHHATEGLGPDIEMYQNKQWGEKQKQKALQGMAYFDSVLADRPYVSGDSFTMADITVFAGLGFAEFAQIEIPSTCKHLKQWKSRISNRPSISG